MRWIRVWAPAVAIAAATALRAQTVDSVSSELVAQGQSVYDGRAGGALCFTCHGPKGRGIPGLGPNLADGMWLHGDGGFAFLQRIITSGIAKPKQAMMGMPAMGGGQLTPAQVAAVSAYVRSLRE